MEGPGAIRAARLEALAPSAGDRERHHDLAGAASRAAADEHVLELTDEPL